LTLSTSRYLSVVLACGLSLGFGCGDDDTAKSTADAAVGGAGGRAGSSGRAGQGGRSGSGAAAAVLGSPCVNDLDCGKLFCDRENDQPVPVTGAPGGEIAQALFPGGSCTPKPLTTYDPTGGSSCDPTEPRGAQGCGSNGVCSIESQTATSVEVACRLGCEPSNTSTGCDRDAYTCDFSTRSCLESCKVDAECRLLSLDSDNDGVVDSFSYDSSSRATCDQSTGRCTHAGGSAALGAACERSQDCSGDSICIADGTDVEGQDFPDGFCSRRGCDISGRECDSGSVCAALRPGLNGSLTEPLCLTSCTVGAEPAELRVGPNGHGAGCRAGYACRYNGGPGASSGVCVGGIYNAVTTNNIGSACKSSEDCYSPYGAGTCLSYGLSDNSSSPGICTVSDCYSPGLPDDLCGSGNDCIGSGADQSMCAHTCKSANDCPTGYACADDDDDASTAKTCYPVCLTDGDCRSNQKCTLYAGQMVGSCTGG
jgi:hypothetical protein